MSVTKTVRQKFRLRTKLVVPFVLQIVAAGLVGYLSFHSSQKAIIPLLSLSEYYNADDSNGCPYPARKPRN